MTSGLPNVPYAAQTAPQMVELDQTFTALAASAITQCTATGTNLIVLAPAANQGAVTAYQNLQQFSFVAANTTTGAVTLQVGSLAALPVYAADGTTQLVANGISKSCPYVVQFIQALNGGSGGFVVVSAGATGVAAGSYNAPNITIDASGRITTASNAALVRSYLAGMALTWTSAAPSTTLSVAAGQAADSTNVTTITLTSGISKSTAGAWVAGTNQNGMGTGLTLASSTWYHVFPIINNSVADAYFDTSVTAANAPAGTTAFRRVGSFLTNNASSAGQISITAFIQRNGDTFLWKTVPSLDVNGVSINATPQTFTLTNVPPGVNVEAILNAHQLSTSGNDAAAYIYSPDISDQAVNRVSTPLASLWEGAGNSISSDIGAQVRVMTNTSAQIRAVSDAQTGEELCVAVLGYVDVRARFN